MFIHAILCHLSDGHCHTGEENGEKSQLTIILVSHSVLRGTEFLREFNFADWRFFVFLRELIFAIGRDWFFLLAISFL